MPAPVVLIDAHNALHRLGGEIPDHADGQRARMLRHVDAVLRTRAGRRRRERVHLIFDATTAGGLQGAHGRDGEISWVYADGSADEAIVRIVRERAGDPSGTAILVVSDDRELCGRARQLGAITVAVANWFRDVADARSPRGREEPDEERRPFPTGPPMRPEDFGMTDAPIDLDPRGRR